MPEPELTALEQTYDVEPPEVDYVPLDTDEFEDETPADENPPQETETKPQEAQEKDSDGDDQSTIDAELAIKAAKFGFEAEDLKGFTKAQLEKTITLLEKAPAQEPEETPGKAQEKQETQETPAGDSAYKVSLDPDEYEPALIEEFNKLHGHYGAVIENLTKQVAEVKAVIQGQYQMTAEKQFDQMIGSLGDEYSAVLGKGDSRSLQKESTEYQNRVKLSDAMNAIAQGMLHTGKTVPPEEELFYQAVRMVFGGEAKESRLSTALRNRRGQFMAKPSNRGVSTTDPVKRAVDNVAAKLREFGEM